MQNTQKNVSRHHVPPPLLLRTTFTPQQCSSEQPTHDTAALIFSTVLPSLLMRRWLGYLAVAILLAVHVHAQQQVTAPRSLSHNHSPCPTGFLLGNSGCELPWRPCGTGCAWDKASALCWPQVVLNSTNTTAAPPPSPPPSTACQRCPMSTGHPCYDASSNTCSTFLPGSTVCRRITDTVCLTDPRPGARLCSSCFPGTYGHCQLDSTWCLLALWDADATPPTLTCASASHACSDSNTGMEALQSVQVALWLPLHTPNASWSMTSFQAQALRSAIANVANVPASFVALTAVEQGDGVHPTAAASLGCHRRLVHSSEGVTMYATIVASLFSAGDGASAHSLATALRGDDAASRIETLSGQTGLRVTGVQNLVPYDEGSSSSDDNADDDGSGSGSGSSDTGDGSGSDGAGSGSGSDDGSAPTDAQGTDAGVEPVRGATTDTSPNGSTMFGLMVLLAGLGGMALLCALCVILMLPRDEDGRRGKGKRRSAVVATRVVSFSDNGHSRNNSSSSSGSHSRASSGGNGSWTGLHLPHSRHPIWRSQRSDGSWSSKPSPSPSSAAAAEAAATAAPAPAPASRANRSHRLAWHDNVNTAAVPHRTTSSGLQRQGGYRQVLQQEERQQQQQQQQGRRRRRRRRQMQGRQQAKQQQVEALRANLPGSSHNVKATAKQPSSSSSSDSESESGSGTSSSSSSASPSSDGSKTSNTAVTKAVAVRRGARATKRQRSNRNRFQAKP